mmetsp:Transcript_7173/g.11898  ORF Transcript_7173/g.11898 Transcript_7173/m.11898 type:complete len:191 (+) Transcript_7173:322-894(+)
MNLKQKDLINVHCEQVESGFRRLSASRPRHHTPTSRKKKLLVDLLSPFDLAARCLKTQQENAKRVMAERMGSTLASVDVPPAREENPTRGWYSSISDMTDMFVWSNGEFSPNSPILEEFEEEVFMKPSCRSSKENKSKKSSKKRSEEKRRGQKKKRGGAMERELTRERSVDIDSIAETVIVSNKGSIRSK